MAGSEARSVQTTPIRGDLGVREVSTQGELYAWLLEWESRT